MPVPVPRRALAAALMALGLVATACSGGDENAATGDTTTTAAAGHTHATETRAVDFEPVPTIEVAAVEDAKSGFNVEVTLTGHRLAPEHASGEHVDGEGHLHYYVDGAKVGRLYTNWFHLDGLEPGEHEVRVELSANDHASLTVDGDAIDETVTVTVPEPDGAMHAHAPEPRAVDFEPVPTIEVAAVEDAKSGFNVEVTLTGHRLAPEHASGEHVDGEGHMHLYVDGAKIGRLYGEWFHLALTEGEHEIRVELSANDHSPLARDGEVLDATAVVDVPAAKAIAASPDDGGGHDAAVGEADHVVDVVVAGGEVDGGAAAVSIRRGEVVRLVVTADIADEVHVHGYDLTVATVAGEPVELAFTADLPGKWEVELEELGLLLATLTVA